MPPLLDRHQAQLRPALATLFHLWTATLVCALHESVWGASTDVRPCVVAVGGGGESPCRLCRGNETLLLAVNVSVLRVRCGSLPFLVTLI